MKNFRKLGQEQYFLTFKTAKEETKDFSQHEEES